MNNIENSFDIEKTLEEFRINNLGKDFIWRKGQKEAIISTVNSYINKTHTAVIIDAPTGSGKSIIAMSISYVLNAYNKKGYILASDLTLQEQYEKDIKKFLLPIGSVKGVDNYTCLMNDEPTSLGLCKISGSTPRSFSCYSECHYFKARNYAASTTTSLLNYSYWLIQQNYVNKHVEEILFEPRDFVICDECHKIIDIVQNHFSPRFDEKTKSKLYHLTTFLTNRKIGPPLTASYRRIRNCITLLYKLDDQYDLFLLLEEIERLLREFLDSINTLKNTIAKKYPKQIPPKEWREASNYADYAKDLHCKVEDYVNIINKTNHKYIIKNPQGEKDIVFNCLQESYVLQNHFHAYCNFAVYLSATIGDPKEYIKDLGITNANYIKIDSSFNFKDCEIYYYTTKKMSYNELENNLPWLFDRVNTILNIFPNQRGIIHTVSYDLTKKLAKNLSEYNKSRLISYDGTEEKKLGINTLKDNENSVLIGPSLLEGIDLPDDYARFTIFLKVPFLSLSDKFTAAKLKSNSGWYSNKAVTNILQGVGRGIRHQTDWCKTFILDANFGNLLYHNRNAFPSEFINRIIPLS